MIRRSIQGIAALLAVALSASTALAYESLQGPTELRLWDQARAFNGYTLFAAHGRTFLIDMRGNVVHRWTAVGTNPKLLDNGNLLDASRDDPSGFGGFQEVDWDGRVVWTYTESRAGYSPHHDFIRVHNPRLGADTTMYIANRAVSSSEALAAGANPASGPYDGTGQADCVVEIDRAGTVVWQWCFIDHLIQDVSPSLPHYAGAGRTVADHPGRLNANLPGRPIRRDWLHCNSLDYNEQLDQVVINSVHGEFYVIDHGGTFTPGDPARSIAAAAGSGGDFLYRFGDPARYRQGDPPSIPENWDTASSGHKQLGGAHDIHWIRPGLPGAGHFLVFNNGQYMHQITNQSYAVEIAPFVDSTGADTGRYVNPPAAGYNRVEYPRDTQKPARMVSKQVTWSFGSLSNVAFFSQIGGSAQRLPNGNTLVCSDTEGHLFEVTSEATPRLVWEYISPVTREGVFAVMPDSLPMTNSVFRAYRFATDHPAFTGRNLSSEGPITGGSTAPATDAGAPPADAPAPLDAAVTDVPANDVAAPPSPVADASAPAANAGAECSSCSVSVGAGADSPVGARLALVLFGAIAARVIRRRKTATRGAASLLTALFGLPSSMGCSSEASPAGADAAATDVGATDASRDATSVTDASTDASTDSGGPTSCDFYDPMRSIGLVRCQPGVEGGYVLFPSKHRGDVYLIDRLGRAVHHWSRSTLEPGQSCYLRPNGNLVRAAMIRGTSIGGGEGGRVEEYDWDDNLVWAFDFATDRGTTHHDFKVMPNGNLLMLAVERKLSAEAVAKGFQASQLRDGYVAPEMVVELARDGAGVRVVWEWHVWDHLVQGRDRALSNYGVPRESPGLLEVTGAAPAFWNHGNSIDYNEALDQVVISARSHNEFWVLDHSTTTAEAAGHTGGRRGHGGDFIYRWGNPQTYGAGTAANRTLFNQHDVQWIQPGLPGAGHILIFNNGLDRPGGNYSTLDELIPAVLPDGSYPALTAGQAWGPTELAWQFRATPPTAFYASEISGAQRLPNGNTLACEGTTSRFFEVTPSGQIVWEYFNPVSNAGPMTQYERASLDPKGHPESAVFKIHWYPASFSGFASRDLTPGSVIERSDTACPSANISYGCRAPAECASSGGADVSARFTCGAGAVCCFKLTQGM